VQANHEQQTDSGRQSTEAADIRQLRADYAATRTMMVEYGEWTQEQSLQIGLAIADAINHEDAGMVAFWRDWFAVRGQAARNLRAAGAVVIDGLRRAA
jgi:hypothetical protein